MTSQLTARKALSRVAKVRKPVENENMKNKNVTSKNATNTSAISDMAAVILKCPLFKGMSAAEVESLIGTCKIRRLEKGDVLEARRMYIILSGRLAIDKVASDGRTLNMRTAVTGEVVNAANVLLKDEEMSRLKAAEITEVVEVSERKLRDMISAGGRCAVNFMEFLSGRISFLNKKITNIGGYSAMSRLGMYLEENAKNGEVTLPMSLSSFANFLGVSRAGLYRAFDSLEEQGVIERCGKKIRIIEN